MAANRPRNNERQNGRNGLALKDLKTRNLKKTSEIGRISIRIWTILSFGLRCRKAKNIRGWLLERFFKAEINLATQSRHKHTIFTQKIIGLALKSLLRALTTAICLLLTGQTGLIRCNEMN